MRQQHQGIVAMAALLVLTVVDPTKGRRQNPYISSNGKICKDGNSSYIIDFFLPFNV